jgi:NAD(P)-dependent dehydrogenase (short-subunit alcohol dehydrogenase family)
MKRPYRAVITGGAGGIGRELALLLASRGSEVVVADVDLEAAATTAADVARLGGRGRALRCDVRQASEMERAVAESEAFLGGIDLWVNNAGVLVTGELSGLALEDYRRVVDINLWGVIHGCHHVVPAMRRRGRGRILNVASLAGAVPLPFMGAYNATKAAVIALSETLAAELDADGIQVTILCPSFTRTRLIDASSGSADRRTMTLARRIMRHFGSTPEDVAALALRAVDRGQLYAIPTMHGRLAWRAKRLAPQRMTRALAFAHSLTRSNRSKRTSGSAPECDYPWRGWAMR